MKRLGATESQKVQLVTEQPSSTLPLRSLLKIIRLLGHAVSDNNDELRCLHLGSFP